MTRYLADTHSFIWFIEGNLTLSQNARDLFDNPDTDICLSVGSLWEMAIKYGLGKLILSRPFDLLIPEQMQRNSISLLNITFEHTVRVANLPLHHRDPFDRLIIAQSLVEDIAIISADMALDAYGIQRIW